MASEGSISLIKKKKVAGNGSLKLMATYKTGACTMLDNISSM